MEVGLEPMHMVSRLTVPPLLRALDNEQHPLV